MSAFFVYWIISRIARKNFLTIEKTSNVLGYEALKQFLISQIENADTVLNYILNLVELRWFYAQRVKTFVNKANFVKTTTNFYNASKRFLNILDLREHYISLKLRNSVQLYIKHAPYYFGTMRLS